MRDRSGALVDDVNFDLRAGERLGIAGGRASGTSALARALAGQPASGETVTGGTVENDGDLCGLAERKWAHLLTGTLEHDELRRALAQGARAVVVDQAGARPDATDSAFLRRTFAEHDTPLVLVSDDLALLRQTCDTVQILLAGRIVERGPAEELFSRPRHRYLAALLAGAPERVHAPTGGCAFEPGCPVGHGRPECSASFPASRSFPGPTGSVTAKCHHPVPTSSADPGRADKEHSR
ncbi:hypothetical protein [Amycolatopsis orientalis]|uniref:hypothetical protein n=1 Tax=Amycolatopsis orientalis TaxID=31958 RepID=UPI00068905FB|nr:hypothetical protein [Amycolatopsis orientalis]